MPILHHSLLAVAFLASAAATRPAKALTPDDIAVVYNSRSPASLAVAEHYVKARGIPPSHLVPIACDPQESIPQNLYQRDIVPAVQNTLRQQGLTDSIKCLVTTYDVPLKIDAVAVGPASTQAAFKLQQRLTGVLDDIARQEEAYDALGREGMMEARVAATHPANQNLADLVKRLNSALTAAIARIDLLPSSDRQKSLQQLAAVHQHVAGISGLLALFHVRRDVPDGGAGQRQLDQFQKQLDDANQQYDDLKKRDIPAAQSAMIDLRLKTHGLVGEAQELQLQIAALSADESEACFDSELALVLADQNYSRAHWILNPRNIETWPMVKQMKDAPRTLMVCRLDGATPAAAMDLVNSALKVEKTGLHGKMYLDARGLTGGDAYATFDADLRTAFVWLKEHSTMHVVLDNRPELLEAQYCPDAALYCGWYSLHAYHESCQWVPGAVGYHVASLEMPTLHKPDDSGWVPQMLKRGVIGTLGAVSEPYLSSFPKPSLFFPLLLSGEFTQGEVWQVTDPWVSWRVGYVGDPLYNPFKADPQVTEAALRAHPVLRNVFDILGNPSGAAAATRPAQGR